jgi:tripartite ATP-independent transporter DctM subunit
VKAWFVDNLALFMFLTMFSVVFTGYPVAFVLGGTALVFALIAWSFGAFELVGLANIVLRMWGGVAADSVLVSISMFILMGTILERSGSAKDMLAATQILLRRVPGGLGVAVMVMGTILAAPIGVVGAAVVLLSLIALPPMLAAGYDTRLALGTVASAGTLGILLPPAIMLVVMAEMLATSAGALFAAATMPGVLLSGLYLIYILVVAVLKPGRAPRLPRSDGPQTWAGVRRVLWRGLAPMTFLMVVVLGSIFAGWATATESAGVGVLGSLLIARLNGRLDKHMLRGAMRDACRANGMVFMLFLGGTGFSYVFRALGGDELMIAALTRLGIDTKWEILGFVMALIFLLGFPFEWIEICLIVIPVFSPVLARLDFADHLGSASFFTAWFGTLVAVNLQTSFMTPPFGATLSYLKGTVPPGVGMGEIYRGMYPFVAIQVVGLVLCILFPGIFL